MEHVLAMDGLQPRRGGGHTLQWVQSLMWGMRAISHDKTKAESYFYLCPGECLQMAEHPHAPTLAHASNGEHIPPVCLPRGESALDRTRFGDSGDPAVSLRR